MVRIVLVKIASVHETRNALKVTMSLHITLWVVMHAGVTSKGIHALPPPPPSISFAICETFIVSSWFKMVTDIIFFLLWHSSLCSFSSFLHLSFLLCSCYAISMMSSKFSYIHLWYNEDPHLSLGPDHSLTAQSLVEILLNYFFERYTIFIEWKESEQKHKSVWMERDIYIYTYNILYGIAIYTCTESLDSKCVCMREKRAILHIMTSVDCVHLRTHLITCSH